MDTRPANCIGEANGIGHTTVDRCRPPHWQARDRHPGQPKTADRESGEASRLVEHRLSIAHDSRRAVRKTVAGGREIFLKALAIAESLRNTTTTTAPHLVDCTVAMAPSSKKKGSKDATGSSNTISKCSPTANHALGAALVKYLAKCKMRRQSLYMHSTMHNTNRLQATLASQISRQIPAFVCPRRSTRASSSTRVSLASSMTTPLRAKLPSTAMAASWTIERRSRGWRRCTS